MKTMIHISGTVCLTEVWLTFSKIPASHHFRVDFKLNEICFFYHLQPLRKCHFISRHPIGSKYHLEAEQTISSENNNYYWKNIVKLFSHA